MGDGLAPTTTPTWSRSPRNQAISLLSTSSESQCAFEKVLFSYFLWDRGHHLTGDGEVPIFMPLNETPGRQAPSTLNTDQPASLELVRLDQRITLQTVLLSLMWPPGSSGINVWPISSSGTKHHSISIVLICAPQSHVFLTNFSRCTVCILVNHYMSFLERGTMEIHLCIHVRVHTYMKCITLALSSRLCRTGWGCI